MTKIPSYLSQGDVIGIVCTARKITKAALAASCELVMSWGFNVQLGKTIDKEQDQFGGTDAERASDFQEMMDHPRIKAIWCARGGYGTVRMIDLLDFRNFCKRPKWVIGYSDSTVLHSHLQTLDIATLHAPLGMDLYKGTEKSKVSFRNSLSGCNMKYKIPSSKKNKLGKARGVLVGGNLSILYSLLGSPSALETSGKILCIEDLDEYLYHIDRMLFNLKRNAYFDNLKGLIVGGMTKMHDNTIPFGKKVKGIILDCVKEYDFPVAFNFPMGHVEDNRALILGAEVLLEVNKKDVKLKYFNK